MSRHASTAPPRTRLRPATRIHALAGCVGLLLVGAFAGIGHETAPRVAATAQPVPTAQADAVRSFPTLAGPTIGPLDLPDYEPETTSPEPVRAAAQARTAVAARAPEPCRCEPRAEPPAPEQPSAPLHQQPEADNNVVQHEQDDDTQPTDTAAATETPTEITAPTDTEPPTVEELLEDITGGDVETAVPTEVP